MNNPYLIIVLVIIASAILGYMAAKWDGKNKTGPR